MLAKVSELAPGKEAASHKQGRIPIVLTLTSERGGRFIPCGGHSGLLSSVDFGSEGMGRNRVPRSWAFSLVRDGGGV
ncbi:hypothetical protein P7K49_023449 [Saguinus oedipus]|uniref:Uncharacterized protein n=1 Tax=Saguinus oedipus TaxID=9490 RepID=A0ABQ9ULP7_SAGOE|nr:hypothetical protein P7K49_023449 [Saguinus oedipus]